jgi:xanthine dehydrogenase YagS FAD-binding subunit
VAFGGVAPRPWRVEAAEKETGAKAIATHAFAKAQPTQDNAFKLTLAERTLSAVLTQARGAA